MASDIKLNDDSIVIEGAKLVVQGSLEVAGPKVVMRGNIGVGTDSPMRSLHVQTGEIHSGGPSAGFSFASRNKGQDAFPDTLGNRWLLYADGGTARLWTSGAIGDVFTVRWNGQAYLGGDAAGYSFCDQDGPYKFLQNALNGERWTWFAKGKVARLRSGKDLLTVTLDGRVGIGTDNPSGQLHVIGGEVHSGGAGAGYSFADRAANTFEANPGKGERWVWYANKKNACLWSGTDKLVITPKGILHVGTVMIGDGKIMVSTGKMINLPSSGPFPTVPIPEQLDLVATVAELRKAVGELKSQVAALKKGV